LLKYYYVERTRPHLGPFFFRDFDVVLVVTIVGEKWGERAENEGKCGAKRMKIPSEEAFGWGKDGDLSHAV
jgi:hypothetical protein